MKEETTHWAEVKSLLVIERVSVVLDELACSEQALPIDVGIEQVDGTQRTYVMIVIDEARDRSFAVCPSSARLLARALGRAADLAGQ